MQLKLPDRVRYRQIATDVTRARLPAGGRFSLHVYGNSMAPLIRDGDVVIVRPVQSHELCFGDIVVSRSAAGDVITHRVIAIDDDTCTTKGDNCAAADPPWPAEAVWGRVIAIEGNERRIDINSRRWRFINRIFGHLNRLELRCMDVGRRAVERTVDGSANRRRSALIRLVQLPFYAVRRLLRN